MKLNENYYVGDYIIHAVESGGNGYIYKCTTAHTATAQVDGFGANVLVDGIVQINFIGANWTQVAETLEALSVEIE